MAGDAPRAWLVPAAVLLTVLALRGRLVRARFRAAGPHRDDLVEMLRDGDAGTLGHMGTWHGNATWTHPGGLGAVAYRVRGDVALTVSDPACAAADRADVVAAFTAFCERNGWVPAFTSVHEPVREILAAEGWTALPVGVESVLDVTTFDLRGKKRQDLRTASNRADREGTATSGRRSARSTTASAPRSRRSARTGPPTGACPRWASRSAGSANSTTPTCA